MFTYSVKRALTFEELGNNLEFLKEFKNGLYDYSENKEVIQGYNDFLNEFPPANLSGLNDYASHLKENDNTDYRTGFNDWLDGFIREENYKDLAEYTDLLDKVDTIIYQLIEEAEAIENLINDSVFLDESLKGHLENEIKYYASFINDFEGL